MNRYDDPSWYEEQESYSSPRQPLHDNLNLYEAHDVSNEERASQRQRAKQPLSPDPIQRIQHTFTQVLLVTALVVIAFLGGWFSHQLFGNSFFNQSDKSKAYAQLFQQAWTTIDQNFVDRKAIDYKNMSYAAIQAMVDSLHDTGHTRFLTADQVQAENQQLSGTFTGIGITLGQDKDTKQVIITSTIPGSPAEKAGLRHEDIIVAVNGVSTTGKDITGVSSLIHGDGKAGTRVAITVKRAGVQQPITISVTRAEITVPNVIMHYIAKDHIAHIQIVQFASDISGQLKDTISRAKKMGATKIILDLRDDPGGFRDEAIKVVSEFLKSGNVLLEQDSTGHQVPFPVSGDTVDTTDPIVVLVNKNTASAAEIVSGALQDSKRATILGEKTFGTGTVLSEFPLNDGSAILVGTEEWLTPKGRFIRGDGIMPNVTVGLSPNATPLTPNDENERNLTEQQILGGDAQMAAAIKYLESH